MKRIILAVLLSCHLASICLAGSSPYYVDLYVHVEGKPVEIDVFYYGRIETTSGIRRMEPGKYVYRFPKEERTIDVKADIDRDNRMDVLKEFETNPSTDLHLHCKVKVSFFGKPKIDVQLKKGKPNDASSFKKSGFYKELINYEAELVAKDNKEAVKSQEMKSITAMDAQRSNDAFRNSKYPVLSKVIYGVNLGETRKSLIHKFYKNGFQADSSMLLNEDKIVLTTSLDGNSRVDKMEILLKNDRVVAAMVRFRDSTFDAVKSSLTKKYFLHQDHQAIPITDRHGRQYYMQDYIWYRDVDGQRIHVSVKGLDEAQAQQMGYFSEYMLRYLYDGLINGEKRTTMMPDL